MEQVIDSQFNRVDVENSFIFLRKDDSLLSGWRIVDRVTEIGLYWQIFDELTGDGWRIDENADNEEEFKGVTYRRVTP